MASNVIGFLHDKNILVTGSTGFLGKIFVEKILRTQPEIRRIFVLLRAEDFESAKIRFKNEVLGVELFRILREQHGDNFENFVFKKVVPVVGDVAADHNLGIDIESGREHLWESLDAIVNIAACTVFDGRFVEFQARYDISLNVNTKGAKNIAEFSKRCRKLQILLHVSTAYVMGTGTIKEMPLKIGETITAGNRPQDESSPSPRLDIEAEFKLLEKALAELHMDSSTTSTSAEAIKHLKELGLNRARRFGWPNTYSFTKAMGEKLLENLSESLPVVILRPTIIESTLAEPFPGWMEGSRTMDTLVIRYGRGRIPAFMADPELILDVIPADMVVNQVIVAMATHACENGLFIYHAASSVGNPLHFYVSAYEAYKYFLQHPCVGNNGKIVKVKKPSFIKTMKSFRQHMHRRYKVPLQAVGVVSKVLYCIRPRYNRMLRTYNSVMYLAELYEPYVFFEGRFDITNTESLLRKISAEDLKAFNFDVKCIDWPHYFSTVHIPGVVKYVLK